MKLRELVEKLQALPQDVDITAVMGIFVIDTKIEVDPVILRAMEREAKEREAKHGTQKS